MSGSNCSTYCWYAGYTIDWQDTLFDYMNQGWTVKAAFDQANADYPGCSGYSCMRFDGDESFVVSAATPTPSQTPTITPTPTVTPTPTPWSFPLRVSFQTYDCERLPDYMEDWGQPYGDDEEPGYLPESSSEIEYGWR